MMAPKQEIDSFSLYLFLNKIANIEHGLFELILSFYCNIEPKNVSKIINFLYLKYRFKNYNILSKTINQINKILKIKTKYNHQLHQKDLLNGILRVINPRLIIEDLTITYNFIPTYFQSLTDIIINDDYFVIDITTNNNMKLRVIVNPSYEYCWIQNYTVLESLKYAQIRLIDIQNSFKFRKKDALKKYSRYHPKFNILKNIELSTIRFFGLSTYYFWDDVEKNIILNKHNYCNQFSIC